MPPDARPPRKFKAMSLWNSLHSLPLALLAVIGAPSPAPAYPIDCAILLCLAGGFPPSLPCAAARIEMIRRITPWPIEPPLQIWRCPMQADFLPGPPAAQDLPISVAFSQGQLSKPRAPARAPEFDAIYDPLIETYLAAIRVYNFSYARRQGHDDNCTVSSSLQVGSYSADGAFNWRRANLAELPAWMFDARYTNCTEVAFRGVGLEWQDYQGDKGTEVVRY